MMDGVYTCSMHGCKRCVHVDRCTASIKQLTGVDMKPNAEKVKPVQPKVGSTTIYITSNKPGNISTHRLVAEKDGMYAIKENFLRGNDNEFVYVNEYKLVGVKKMVRKASLVNVDL